MSAARTVRGKLSARLRELFATLRRQPAEPPPVSFTPVGMESREVSPPQCLLDKLEPTSAADPTLDAPTASKARQAALFELPDPRPGERVLFLEDFLTRFRDAMRRSGVIARDPLHPVFTMLGEMLVHFSHLQVDQVTTSKHSTRQFVTGMAEVGEKVQSALGKESRTIADAVADAVTRIEMAAEEVKKGRVDVARGFGSDLEAALRAYTWTRTRRERRIAAAVQSVAALVIAAGGVWCGQSSEQQSMELTLKALKEPIVEAAMRDGRKTAGIWLGIMEWNHFDQMPRTCTPPPFGSRSRRTCTMTYWAEPPLDEPPPR